MASQTEYFMHIQFTFDHIKCTIVIIFSLCTVEEGLRSAERVTAALYGKSSQVLSNLNISEMEETFRGASIVELLMQPATSILDMAMKARCFANESQYP